MATFPLTRSQAESCTLGSSSTSWPACPSTGCTAPQDGGQSFTQARVNLCFLCKKAETWGKVSIHFPFFPIGHRDLLKPPVPRVISTHIWCDTALLQAETFGIPMGLHRHSPHCRGTEGTPCLSSSSHHPTLGLFFLPPRKPLSCTSITVKGTHK